MVPAGLYSRPFLVVLFIHDMFKLSNKNFEIYFFTDDSAIIFYKNNVKELQTIVYNFFLNYAA